MLDGERDPSTADDRLSGAHASLWMTRLAWVLDRLLGSKCACKSARATQTTSHDQLLNQRASVATVRFFFWSDHYCGGYAVAGFEVKQADALGVAAGFADGF